MDKKFLSWGFFFGGLAIIIGAFGAHALKSILSTADLSSFETGVRYQMYHALLLILLSQVPKLQTKLILNALIIGIFLFSFSIYLLNLKDFMNMPFLQFLGPITPIGGVFLIGSWLILLKKSFHITSNADR